MQRGFKMASNSHLLHKLSQLECQDSTNCSESPALVLKSGVGSEIKDVAGKTYIDLCSGFGSLALGHNHAVTHSVLQESCTQNLLLQGLGDVAPSHDKVALLDLLNTITPEHLTKTSLALSGSQAVEIALKTAMLATKSSGFIAFEGGYHGVDLGVLPVTWRQDFKAPFNNFLPQNHVIHLPLNAPPDLIAESIYSLNKTVGCAGIIVEPIQGRGGMNISAITWLKSLRDLCDKHDILLIFDEIFTGLGRIGSLTTSETVAADLCVFGKALGGGMPISACMGTEKAMSHWPKSQGEAIHTGTFFGHPLSCRVAHATVAHIQQQNLVERSRSLGEQTRVSLSEIDGAKVRGQGLFLGLFFDKPELGVSLAQSLKSWGVLAIPCGHGGSGLSITPALNIPESLLADAIGRIKACLEVTAS